MRYEKPAFRGAVFIEPEINNTAKKQDAKVNQELMRPVHSLGEQH
jgi:hypothetical protein